jgi:hypothetical protein
MKRFMMIDDSKKVWMTKPKISKHLVVSFSLQVRKKIYLSYLICKTSETLQFKPLTIVALFY